MVSYIYLHGFASSPQSTKARELSDRFQTLHLPLQVPDLNQNDFSHLTLTRQLQQIATMLPESAACVRLIGSSFGGLTAAWLAERYSQVERIVLLAPAFSFLAHWLPRLGAEQVQRWQQDGYLSVYHYQEQTNLPLHYGFVTDAAQYPEHYLQRPVPTLILHGHRDEVIPIEASRTYAESRPWVQWVALDSDHALIDVQDEIWAAVRSFFQI